MIYTFLADISCIEVPCTNSYLGDKVVGYIELLKNPRAKKERSCAYILLSHAVKELFGKNPEIIWADNGKPRFADENIYFNISHSRDLVAVTISDRGAVGVDAEGEIDPERGRRLEMRFFSGLTFSDSHLDVKYIYSKIDSEGNVCFSEFAEADDGKLISSDGRLTMSSVPHSESFSARWTLYEARLKCDGGGFTSLPCLDMLLLESRADIKKIKVNSQVYYLTTATGK